MALVDRLSKLDAPDREVDAEIDRALGLHVDVGEFSGPWTRYPEPDHYRQTTPYTASIDAAIALAERVLPGWTIARLGQDDSKLWNAELRQGHLTAFDRVTLGGAPNGAIALCIAILRAKEVSNDQ